MYVYIYLYVYMYIYIYICKREIYIDKPISLYSLLSTSRSVYKVPFLTKPGAGDENPASP